MTQSGRPGSADEQATSLTADAFWTGLSRVLSAWGIGSTELASWLEASAKDVERLIRDGSFPTVTQLDRLASRMAVSLDTLLDDPGRLEGLAPPPSMTSERVLPDRYLQAARSRLRTSMDILAYLERFYGFRVVHRILARLRVPRWIFSDPEGWISIHLLQDLCSELERAGFGERSFFDMGVFSSVINRDTDFARQLISLRTGRRMHECFFESVVHRFDRNSSYRVVALSDESCEVEVTASGDVVEELKTRKAGSALVCQTRAGRAAAITALGGLGEGSAVETRCVHRGDPTCRYRIGFPIWPRARMGAVAGAC